MVERYPDWENLRTLWQARTPGSLSVASLCWALAGDPQAAAMGITD
jgi:hypothetical protein